MATSRPGSGAASGRSWNTSHDRHTALEFAREPETLSHARLRSRSLAPAIFRRRRLPRRRQRAHRGRRRVAVVSEAPLGLQQAERGREPGLCLRPARHRAAVLSGLLETRLQPARHGHRQPPAAQLARIQGRPAPGTCLDADPRRRTHLDRHRGGRRTGEMVAAYLRRAAGGRHVRPLGRAGRGAARNRAIRRRLDRQTPLRLHRHGEFRDHRRPDHRGAPALRRPVAGPLRRPPLGRGADRALRERHLGLRRQRPPRRLFRRAVRRARHPVPSSAARPGRGDHRRARHHQRADHLSRGPPAGLARDAARRVPSRTGIQMFSISDMRERSNSGGLAVTCRPRPWRGTPCAPLPGAVPGSTRS